MASQIPQHKRLAMGEKVGFKSGGIIGASARPANLKTGLKDSPLETVKRANGIPGMKKGGKC